MKARHIGRWKCVSIDSGNDVQYILKGLIYPLGAPSNQGANRLLSTLVVLSRMLGEEYTLYWPSWLVLTMTARSWADWLESRSIVWWNFTKSTVHCICLYKSQVPLFMQTAVTFYQTSHVHSGGHWNLFSSSRKCLMSGATWLPCGGRLQVRWSHL